MSIDTELINEILLDYAFALRTGELDGAGRYIPEVVEDEAFALTEVEALRMDAERTVRHEWPMEEQPDGSITPVQPEDMGYVKRVKLNIEDMCLECHERGYRHTDDCPNKSFRCANCGQFNEQKRPCCSACGIRPLALLPEGASEYEAKAMKGKQIGAALNQDD